MAADLAIDVGIPKDSEEFGSFCGCVENILEYGCGYGDDFTENILEKCRKSELDIAKRVIVELEKPRSKYRQRKLKWWEEYTPKEKQRARKETRPSTRVNPRRPDSGQNHRGRDANRPHATAKRPMSPMFQRNTQRRGGRPSSPPIRYERGSPERYKRHNRPMSPMFQRSRGTVPEWPGSPSGRSQSDRYSENHGRNKKRRRFR